MRRGGVWPWDPSQVVSNSIRNLTRIQEISCVAHRPAAENILRGSVIPKEKGDALAAPPMFIPPAQKHQILSALERCVGFLIDLQSALSKAIESLRAGTR